MPKKPFTPEEIKAQRERIMESASQVMADAGFHHLSMRKLATQLGMTASNIYNYFPNKEVLFVETRRWGYERLFHQLKNYVPKGSEVTSPLHVTAYVLIEFAKQHPGFYQLMFQPPRFNLGDETQVEKKLCEQVEQLVAVWQQQITSQLVDTMGQDSVPRSTQQQLTIFFMASLHGLIDSYHYQALPAFSKTVDLITEELIVQQIDILIRSVQHMASSKSSVEHGNGNNEFTHSLQSKTAIN